MPNDFEYKSEPVRQAKAPQTRDKSSHFGKLPHYYATIFKENKLYEDRNVFGKIIEKEELDMSEEDVQLMEVISADVTAAQNKLRLNRLKIEGIIPTNFKESDVQVSYLLEETHEDTQSDK